MVIRAQIAMVMNLDKCIGCHTCSVTCKNTWTNRPGTEYIWFNNVETKPGIGYPKAWEDQDRHRGGWSLAGGALKLRAGGPLPKLLRIFHNPDLPPIDDYYEPWTYDYETLIRAPVGRHQPVARARSAITGAPIDLQWGPNWEDDLAGAPETARGDPNLAGIQEQVRLEYERTFLLYLPRICEHCLNPACVASCPSGAMYKRTEDGIVLVDQEACRGWRFCVSGCPYKKVYFNWRTQKAEKCTFCYPRIEAGLTTVCSETCVGRIRYVGLVLYDSDAVERAASTTDPRGLYESQLALFLDPSRPEVARQAVQDGVPEAWVEAARRSPVYRLAVRWRLALPLHPEFRTLPMVWYIPPLSPILARSGAASDAGGAESFFPTLESMRIPLQYLANLLTAGDVPPVARSLRILAAVRSVMRAKRLGESPSASTLEGTGLTLSEVEEIYRLLALARYDERFVVPPAHRESASDVYFAQGAAGFAITEGQADTAASHHAESTAPWATPRLASCASCPLVVPAPPADLEGATPLPMARRGPTHLPRGEPG